MLDKTRGLVLGYVKYGETSIIAKVYTEKFGLQSYMINGVRKSRSRTKISLFEPLSLLEMDIYHKERSDLKQVKEIRPAHIFKSIPFNVVKQSLLVFLSEVLKKSIREEEANPDLFDFICRNIIYLDQQEKEIADFHNCFLMELTKYLGFYPVNNYSSLNKFFDLREGHFISFYSAEPGYPDERISALLNRLLNDYNGKGFSAGNHSDRRALLECLLQYYRSHIDHFGDMKTVRVLEEILS